jgi:hypothetical protein
MGFGQPHDQLVSRHLDVRRRLDDELDRLADHRVNDDLDAWALEDELLAGAASKNESHAESFPLIA